MRPRSGPAFLVSLGLLGQGCATVAQAKGDKGPAVFGGVRRSSSRFLGSLSPDFNSCGPPPLLYWIVLPLDFPFTLLADTVLLPVSIPNEVRQGGIDAGG